MEDLQIAALNVIKIKIENLMMIINVFVKKDILMMGN